jgi:hypothetical protein
MLLLPESTRRSARQVSRLRSDVRFASNYRKIWEIQKLHLLLANKEVRLKRCNPPRLGRTPQAGVQIDSFDWCFSTLNESLKRLHRRFGWWLIPLGLEKHGSPSPILKKLTFLESPGQFIGALGFCHPARGIRTAIMLYFTYSDYEPRLRHSG